MARFRMFAARRIPCWLPVVGLLASGCPGGSSVSEYEQVRQVEQGFVDQITAAGGTAKMESRVLVQGKYEDAGWFIDLSGDTITDSLIDAIIAARGGDPMFDLNLSGSTITDEQLAKLDAGKVLQQVFILDLTDTAITDAGLDKCENVHALKEFKIKGSKITKEGAQRLGERKAKHASTPAPFKGQPKLDL